MILKRITVAVFIFLPVILHGSTRGVVEINTRHFTVIYPAAVSDRAISITCKSEEVITSLINFMQYEPPGRIILRISVPDKYMSVNGSFFYSLSPGSIEIEALDYPGWEINLSEIIFTRYMELFARNFKGIPGINNLMHAGLMHYMIYGTDDKAAVMLNDLVANRNNGELRINASEYFNDGGNLSIAVFFWDYLASVFGRDAMAGALKDAAYFDGFFNALYTITDSDASAVDRGFRNYLSGHIKHGQAMTSLPVEGFKYGAGDILAHCSLREGEIYALISESGGRYNLFYRLNGKAWHKINMGHAEYRFTSVTACGDRIVVSGYDRYGSVLICYDPGTGKKVREREFPLIYIDHIDADNAGERIIFSAYTSGRYSLFVYNNDSVVILKTEGEGINLMYPAFTESGRILYVRKDAAESLMLFDEETGSSSEIYRTSNTLGRPCEDPAGNILYSETVNGVTDIRCLEKTGLSVRQLTAGSTSNIDPVYIMGRLYFLNYYLGGYRPASLLLNSK